MSGQRYEVTPMWRLAIKGAGLREADVLRRARLPEDLLNQRDARISAAEYFQLFSAIHEGAADPMLALKIGAAPGGAHFDPVIYAGFCSPDLNHAAGRIAQFKRLLAPVVLRVDVDSTRTSLRFTGRDPGVVVPPAFSAAEMVWWIAFVRSATREHVRPRKVMLTERQDDAYLEFFGCAITVADRVGLEFDAADAQLPFLAANEEIWRHLAPTFQTRLADLESESPTKDRIVAVLIEMLPAGQSALADVGRRLGVGARTLQRKLSREGTSYQRVLSETREQLAMHYLKSSRVSCTEIAFLLGFEDPNSFFRAFHGWTGQTPEATRAQLQVA